MTKKKDLLNMLDSYIISNANSSRANTFCLNDVTKITGETLPGKWLYETIIAGRYSNVWLTGKGRRGNIYTIASNANKN